MPVRNLSLLSAVHREKSKSRMRKLKLALDRAGEGVGDGEGPGEGPGEGLGLGDGELHEELNHTHDVDMHIPSADDEDMPVLHVAKTGHQPQLAADVQSKQDVSEPQVSGGGGGGGAGGTEPVEKAVQLKTDSTGSVAHIEFATPQLLLMVL